MKKAALWSLLAFVLLGAGPQWQPTTQDMVALKRAAVAGGEPHVTYWARSTEQMPPWDRIAFYPGRNDQAVFPGGPVPQLIYENRDTTLPGRTRKLNDALILAAMDLGWAGPRWMQYYAYLNERDRSQGLRAKDPYHYRHAFLNDLDERLAALAPKIPALATDPSIDTDAASLTETQIGELVKGVLEPKKPRESVSDATPAPPISEAVEKDYEFYTNSSPPGYEEAMFGTYLANAARSGIAGPDWKAMYDAAPDKARFSRVLGRAYQMANDRMAAKSRESIRWVRSSLSIGSTRDQVAAKLQTKTLRLSKGNPAILEFPISSSIACGTEIDLRLTFDAQNEHLIKIEQLAPYTACM